MHFLRAKRYSLGIDMAPLIDVVFLLLIFFMLSSSFLKPSLKLELPQATSHETIQKERIVVVVDAEKNILINHRASSLGSLQSDLRSLLGQAKEKAVHLQGDQSIPYGYFVELMDQIRQAGGEQIHLTHELKT